MKNQNAVLLFARTPEITRSVADEPFAALPWEDLDAIFHACLGDLVNRAVGVPDVDVLVYRDERYLPESKFPRPPQTVRFLDMPAGDFDRAVGQAVEHAFYDYYHRVVVVLENNPLLGTAAISRALDMLGTDDDAVVVAPASSGGAGFLALKANHPSLFAPARSGPGTPQGILGKICELDAHLYPTDGVMSVDSPATIDLLRRQISVVDPSDPDFPELTSRVFGALEKKYRLKKVGA